MDAEARGKHHILYVTDGFAPFVVGGMQSYSRRQLELLSAAGYRLTSISTRDSEPPSGLSWENISLPWPSRTLADRLNPWRYVQDLRRFSRSVAEVADRLKPDLIYSEGPLVDALLRRPARPAPIIFHPHALDIFQGQGSRIADIKAWPLRGLIADHARRADATISLSKAGRIMQILQDRIGVPRERIATIHNAADLQDFRSARTAPSGSRRFLFVGRDDPRKALPILMQAFGTLKDATLDLVGIEPSATYRLAGVTAHGVVRDADRLRQFYEAADFLVLPSHVEGMATVILEAFAAGLPAIVTDVGANADLVRPDETGFIVPPRDVDAFAKAMHDALALPAQAYARFSANALESVRGPFSATAARDRLLDLLDESIKLAKDG